jgi:hypothetical protein
MNRKNLTAAVLAGLAGAAGIAGTAQAVNMNPDGLGQVLIYPYYTTNGGNQTIMSVVNTTDNAKAVKVRYLEGFNSREVLDFNLYLSAWDVWVAAIADDAGTPTLYIPDDSCTVPYLYGDFGGVQPFLNIAYNDNDLFSNDGGPTGIARAAEGHVEVIEMGTIEPGSPTEADITHRWHDVVVGEDDDGKDIVEKQWFPGDCDQLVANWTRDADYSPLGMWTCDTIFSTCSNNWIDIDRNSGGLFGGAAVVNAENGTMYSYNAQAIQGYDDTDGHRHREPGQIYPNLNSGNQHSAYVFFGVPQNEVQKLHYPRPVGAVSAVFMHENLMNEYTLDDALAASTEWVVTFPTKAFYVDEELVSGLPGTEYYYWEPTVGAPNCNNWMPGDPNPAAEYSTGGDMDGYNPNTTPPTGWEFCTFQYYTYTGDAIRPFTDLFQPDGKACELATIQVWDRDERSPGDDNPSGTRPPVVSPSIPGACDPEIQVCEPATPFELCYEVNVVRFGDGDIFATPEVEGSSLLISVDLSDETPGSTATFKNGWGKIDFSTNPEHVDRAGLVGLPATGFAAFEFENDYLADDVKAYYGGLFGHRGNVRRTNPRRGQDGPGSSGL